MFFRSDLILVCYGLTLKFDHLLASKIIFFCWRWFSDFVSSLSLAISFSFSTMPRRWIARILDVHWSIIYLNCSSSENSDRHFPNRNQNKSSSAVAAFYHLPCPDSKHRNFHDYSWISWNLPLFSSAIDLRLQAPWQMSGAACMPWMRLNAIILTRIGCISNICIITQNFKHPIKPCHSHDTANA